MNKAQTRRALLEALNRIHETDGLCYYCGKSYADQIDHVIPQSQGGSHHLDNLVPACYACNASKGSRTPFDWRAAQREAAGIVGYLEAVRLMGREPYARTLAEVDAEIDAEFEKLKATYNGWSRG